MPPPPYNRGIPPPPPHPGDGKRKAPISAGAFAFDLSKIGTPQKKPRTVISGPNDLQTPSRRSVTPAPRSTSTIGTPQRASSVALFSVHAPSTVTPLKQAKPLGALPSPFAVTPARVVTTPDVKHRPLKSIMDDASPFILRPGTSGPTPKEGEKLVKLGELSTSRVSATPQDRLRREDEGVGVSPRKPRAIKWNGKGDMPASIHLAQVLHTVNSSLVLFYNSLQRLLHPPARPSKPAFGSKTTSPDRTPTVIQHIRTAHIRLHPLSLAWSRTHNGIVLKCDVIKRRELPGEATTTTTTTHTASNADGETDVAEILLVLQPVPHECARLGVDPKVVVGKMQEGTNKTWEIGIWSPYQEMDLRLDSRASEEAGGTASPTRTEDVANDDKANSSASTTPILFASRYLIAEI